MSGSFKHEVSVMWAAVPMKENLLISILPSSLTPIDFSLSTFEPKQEALIQLLCQ